MTQAANKIRTLRKDLSKNFPERSNVIDGMLASVLASEHVLLLGPPGVAKSCLSRAVAGAFSASYFERLLTKFSTPDELFGPVSLKALEQDHFERVIEGKLPTVEIGFIDETFKANSAILNSLLSIMNERIFHNDGEPVKCPLITLIGASNELPEGRELEALFDRFLLRFDVQYLVQLSNLREVLLAPDPGTKVYLTMDELLTAQEEAMGVEITSKTVDGMISIRDACQAEGIVASDRRWKKSLKIVKASAYMMGQEETSLEDLAILTDSLWREPRERSKVSRIVGQYADPIGSKAQEVLEAAREVAKTVIGLKRSEQGVYFAAAAKAREQFVEMKAALSVLAVDAGERTKIVINDAMAEVSGMYAEATRALSENLGLMDKMIGLVKGK